MKSYAFARTYYTRRNKSSKPVPSADSFSDEEYEVESILGKRFAKSHRRFEYFIKWAGYDDSYNTWEPKENLNCPVLLQSFEESWSNRSERVKKNTLDNKVRAISKRRKSANGQLELLAAQCLDTICIEICVTQLLASMLNK
jgi:hypothetical protein